MRTVQKALRFPLGGLARNLNYRDTTYPSEESVYSTPLASNVIGECAFSSRARGGSRPGMTEFTGTQPSRDAQHKWLWPNGEVIKWSSDSEMVYAVDEPVVMPDGGVVVDQHESFTVNCTKGNVPDTASAVALYRDRLFVASGNMWYASRTTDHGDFDYGGEKDDVTRPVAGTISASAHKGETVTAFMPVGDERMFLATNRRVCVIEGEPTSGMKTLSEFTGVISHDAWCNADGSVYFVGQNGLYAFAEGGPMLVSSQIPEALRGLASAVLVYDPERKAIHILATASDGTRTDWFYDIGNKAFWPLSYDSDERPLLGGAAVIGGVNRTVFLCADGSWRYWDDTTDCECESFVAIGPFKCGTRDDTDGMLDKLTVTLAKGSEDVSVEVYTANSAEMAVYSAENCNPERTYTFGGGWNENVHARCRGAWCLLLLRSEGKWAYESITAATKTLGGLRNG